MKTSVKVTLASGLFVLGTLVLKIPGWLDSDTAGKPALDVLSSHSSGWLPPVDGWWWTLMTLFGATILVDGIWTFSRLAYVCIKRKEAQS